MFDAIAKVIGSGLDYFNAEKNRDAQMAMAAQNVQLQKDFAQQGIRWKVEDAKAAGVHPLYALGASSSSFSPVSIGSLPESDFSSALGSMGQDLSRAVNATRTQDERAAAFEETARKLDLEGKGLDNDIKRATLASSVQRIKQAANPPMPGTVPGNVPADDFTKQDRLSAGNEWLFDPNMSPAQAWEDRYGETISDWVMGPAVGWKDYLYNYPRVDAIIEGMKVPATFGERFGQWRRQERPKSGQNRRK